MLDSLLAANDMDQVSVIYSKWNMIALLLALSENPLKSDYIPCEEIIKVDYGDIMNEMNGEHWETPGSFTSASSLSDWSDEVESVPETRANLLPEETSDYFVEDIKASDSMKKWAEGQYWRVRQKPVLGMTWVNSRNQV
jgi:hypothetical protein